MPSTVSLNGKNIFISGASRGLGAAMAVEFARLGAAVAFVYSRDDSGARTTYRAVLDQGVACLIKRLDILDVATLTEFVREIENTWGGIDVLVNNAGITQSVPLPLLDETDWDRLMNINVKGYYLCTQAVVPGMIRKKGGVILNIGSLAGTRMIAAPVHYTTSKAAIKGFTEALCKELGRYSIRVNSLAPGLLEDGVSRALPAHALENYLEVVPLGRLGTLREVARMAAFMVSDRNTYMNGNTILMDGGL